MTTLPKTAPRKRPMASATGASWIALVAATTVGIGSVHRVRAAVSADPTKLGESHQGYRLIVQSYAPSSLARGELPAGRAKPLASTQRAITREQLARGVAVDMLGLGSQEDAPVIVAWVESGPADLDYDAFEARPAADAFYGVATATDETGARAETRVVLKRRAAG